MSKSGRAELTSRRRTGYCTNQDLENIKRSHGEQGVSGILKRGRQGHATLYCWIPQEQTAVTTSPYSTTPRDFLGWDMHKTKKQRKHKEKKTQEKTNSEEGHRGGEATEPMCANGANRKPCSTGCKNPTRRRNETAVTERARDEQRGETKRGQG